jgi:hypothetical protein
MIDCNWERITGTGVNMQRHPFVTIHVDILGWQTKYTVSCGFAFFQHMERKRLCDHVAIQLIAWIDAYACIGFCEMELTRPFHSGRGTVAEMKRSSSCDCIKFCQDLDDRLKFGSR